jgi:hypothetical protein
MSKFEEALLNADPRHRYTWVNPLDNTYCHSSLLQAKAWMRKHGEDGMTLLLTNPSRVNSPTWKITKRKGRVSARKLGAQR